jgi:phosphomannomutase
MLRYGSRNQATLDMSVYMPCDIRGPVSELSTDLYAAWGRSIGRRLDPGSDVYVGGDVRTSTPEFLEALVFGLYDTMVLSG